MSASASGSSGRKTRLWIPISTGILLTALIVVSFIVHKSPPGNIEDNRLLLNTLVSIKIFQSKRIDVLDEAFSLIEEYENMLSRHKSGSEISRINAAPAGTPVSVSGITLEIIETALYYAELSGGRFDPSVGPLVDLWGIGTEHPHIPDAEELSEVLPLVDYKSVLIDKESDTVTLTKEGMALDLGGITKGWIADRVGEFLIENGETHFLINLGGNVLVHGGKPSGGNSFRPFRIGMQNPFKGRGNYLGVFSLEEGSVVSSGVYERFFESNGIRYHHILDTSSGFPVENSLAAVTIISEFSLDGDALSTTLFTLGITKGLELVKSLEGVEAAFITREGKVILTAGASAIFEAPDDNLPVQIVPDD